MKNTIQTVDVFEVATVENFDEKRYLSANSDVADLVASGGYASGWRHFKRHGRKEVRKQIKDDYRSAIQLLRKIKAQRIGQILKAGIDIEQTPEHVFDYTGESRKGEFGFEETENVSSFFYDETPLDILNALPDGLILDCGAGFRPVYYSNVVNYEIVNYPTTDVIGFAEDLPFADNSFDAVFSFAVLEHVKLPFLAAEEMCRVLKPGGIMAVCAAFLQPQHGYPHHYFNMTRNGLKVLFENQIDIEKQFVNSGMGPIWSLTWFLQQWSKSLTPSDRRQFHRMKVADLIGQPHQYLDKNFVTNLPEEPEFELASATFLVGTKKE